MFRNKILVVAGLGLSLFTIGCATAGTRGDSYTDAEVEMAMHRAEDATLARLAASNNHDVADAAGSLAREHARR